MHGEMLYFKYLLCIAVCAGTVLALTCERPRDTKECEGRVARCRPVSEEICSQVGSLYVKRQSPCELCDFCAIFVGSGASCNITQEHRSGSEEIVYVTHLCSSSQVCSKQSNGKCVNKKDCKYA